MIVPSRNSLAKMVMIAPLNKLLMMVDGWAYKERDVDAEEEMIVMMDKIIMRC